MNCDDIGFIRIYDRNGHYVDISHEDSVNICSEAVETGNDIADIIRKRYMRNLKLIKFMDMD
ncbi:hypothetical protein [Picrophilus oshimae]|uniref:Uncharacterized protein n=1 Tax=Picrophilus torridus (strain ATCC 700027 / DSM 9790 / JCM 10055 / NBRC 100828 / KAW 2/3) TaxID=1122961 RepID=Q6KYY6_PICTO|nr:hypothetical protein [Picrophilus oshimae]AAT44066.1 hypothetical protein PTO1481 [Picrophilus oshimae DSM 9789]SMD30864.1 hypothetical protein SAMN02745355_0780 [Picrophilus oshimae DSM 9789]